MFYKLDENLQKAIADEGFDEPTQVQSETFVHGLAGKDLFVSAETGSGKTVAYLLPMFERLLSSPQGDVLALVLVPTRELARQVLLQAKVFSRYTSLTVGHIGGGTDIKLQNKLLKELPQILVATPGRLLKVIERGELELGNVESLVLDEADRLLDMGFSEDIISIASHCPGRQQTQLYSATLVNKSLRGFAGKLLSDPKVLFLNKLTDSHDSIKQQIIFADDDAHKFKLIYWLLQNETYRRCLIFCNSKDHANQLCGRILYEKFTAGILHGDRDQKQRNSVMHKLRRGELKILVATDIAARGLDIEGMDLIINFDMPRKGETYIHRIGRTGRGELPGTAISLISTIEFNLMSSIERFLKQSFERRRISSLIGNYNGPKKLKASGKAAGTTKKKKMKKIKLKAAAVKKRSRVKKSKKS